AAELDTRFIEHHHDALFAAPTHDDTAYASAALVALDTGAVTDEYEVIRWDGKPRGIESGLIPQWNRDQTLASGLRYSTVWLYQILARRAGAAKMQQWIDRVDYGNRDIGGGIDQFWLTGKLRISAREQIDFLRRLADGQLPFSARAQEAVRRISVIESAPHYVMHAKTGWAGSRTRQDPAGKAGSDIGWYVGWLEADGRRWFFALNIDMRQPADQANRSALVRQALVQLGALPIGHDG
ncbi:MAG: penicillin-binding transpeptidase domain-containing protein, partial [Rhodanobacter sp.]